MASDDFDPSPWLDDISSLYQQADPAHDFSHILRVYRTARKIGQEEEKADMRVLLPAALLHDLGSKKGFESGQEQAGQAGLGAARAFLQVKGLDGDRIDKVLYAVEVHSFSRGIIPTTLEARILQDADRLDAMGAIGIARLFVTGGALGREMYHLQDPFCREREPDDKRWNLDHFYRKLLKLESGMHTSAARRLAAKRAAVLKQYLQDLEEEIGK
ncbi:MAG TPA: HD domain-containing protein [Methanothrix sp.]|nr:HD domain-containing protein [Methanothrix sp.]HQJ80037.1 HD domain-containing protein [Methanothrix sp.]HUM80927.1 HD domain-containing protein [Methanothrix sp.]